MSSITSLWFDSTIHVHGLCTQNAFGCTVFRESRDSHFEFHVIFSFVSSYPSQEKPIPDTLNSIPNVSFAVVVVPVEV